MKLIDEDAVIKAIDKHTNSSLQLDEDITCILEEIPTIEERKTGEWIPSFGGKFTGGAYWFSCSKCKRIVPEVRNGGWNYCPNCGADMRGGQNESD